MREVDDGFYLGFDFKYKNQKNDKNKYFQHAISNNLNSLCIEVEDKNHIIIIEKDNFFSRIKYYNYMEKKTEKIYNFKNEFFINSIMIHNGNLIICNAVFCLKSNTYKNRVYNNGKIFYNVKEKIIDFLNLNKKIDNIKF